MIRSVLSCIIIWFSVAGEEEAHTHPKVGWRVDSPRRIVMVQTRAVSYCLWRADHATVDRLAHGSGLCATDLRLWRLRARLIAVTAYERDGATGEPDQAPKRGSATHPSQYRDDEQVQRPLRPDQV